VRAQRHVGLLLEPRDDVDGVTAHEGRVRPVEGFFQRRRHHRCRHAPHSGDPWVTHAGVLGARDQQLHELPIGVGPEDHPLLRVVGGKAVLEQLGALLTPVAAPVAAVGAVAVASFSSSAVDRGWSSFGSTGPPFGWPLTPSTNVSAPIRRRLGDFFRGSSGTPVVSGRLHRRGCWPNRPGPYA
jgi:hypothetical protein